MNAALLVWMLPPSASRSYLAFGQGLAARRTACAFGGLLALLALQLGCPAGSTPDGGAPDAGARNGRVLDAGAGDGGGGDTRDAGNGDAGNGDAGNGDAGNGDAGNDGGAPIAHAPPTAAGVAYFADIDDELNDGVLIAALQSKLAADHVELGFADLFSAYADVDSDRAGCAGIFDFYSDSCWAPGDACGQYAAEGDCFNREHSWPKSWWGGATGPAQHQDLIMVLPADGYVNGVRGNLPFGDVDDPDYISQNGSRRGPCAVPGAPAGALCFAPAPGLKGDFARIYFYMAVRYEGQFSCCDEDAVNRSDIKAWQESMLRSWSDEDPVDLDERERNERVFTWQKNRNPFVDFPSFAERIADF